MTKVVKSKEDLKKLQIQRRYKIGLQAAVVLGVCFTIYGYKVGQKRGYENGLNVGYVTAGHEIVESWRKHAEEMRLAREVKL